MEGAIYLVGWRLSKYQHPLIGDERSVVVSALRHFDRERYALYAFVVMDDHVHVVVQPSSACPLEKTIHSWKSFTAGVLVRRFSRRAPIWQAEYYDHIIRDNSELEVKAQYVLDNPYRRWADIEAYPWVGTGSGDTEINRHHTAGRMPAATDGSGS